MSGAAAAARRLGVLGTPVWDTIWTEEDRRRGQPFESWGGITYALAAAAAAAAAAPMDWEIVPLVKVGADLANAFHGFLKELPSWIRRDGVLTVTEPNNRVELTYDDASRRGERQRGALPGWTAAEILAYLGGLDALYVNFISGAELDLATVRAVRDAFAGPIHADLHSLFLGCAGAGTEPRARTRLPQWEQWVRCFDMVQLNDEELATLADPGEALAATLERLHRVGPQLAAATLGAEGALLAGRWAGEAVRAHVPTARSEDGDATGCGDVWGATFCARLVNGDAPVDAAVAAHRAALDKLRHRGATGLYRHLVGATAAAKG